MQYIKPSHASICLFSLVGYTFPPAKLWYRGWTYTDRVRNNNLINWQMFNVGRAYILVCVIISCNLYIYYYPIVVFKSFLLKIQYLCMVSIQELFVIKSGLSSEAYHTLFSKFSFIEFLQLLQKMHLQFYNPNQRSWFLFNWM